MNGDAPCPSGAEPIPEVARTAVLRASEPASTDGEKPLPPVKGHSWEPLNEATSSQTGVDFEALLASYATTGFQATNLSLAAEQVSRMLECRDVPLAADSVDEYEQDEYIRKRNNCTVFLGYTSNIMSSGLRETILYLVKNKMVDVLVTSAGGVEEDFIKCLAPTLVADWSLDGRKLRERGLNRIGNLLVPNDNYCKFEEWATPLLDEMLDEQRKDNCVWTPSKVIARLGERVADESSVYYWAWRNKIPVFSPALTDGALGDIMYFHSYRRPGLILDVLGDLKRLNSMAVKANNSGMLILGGGVVKHHICNANLMRNGADYAVFINTGTEYDGSDAGARPDEAVSWGKIRPSASPVKVHADATLVFPLLVALTFSRHHRRRLAAGDGVHNGGGD